MAIPDYFELFGLEPKLRIDPVDLEQRFYRLSRQLHPDRYVRAIPAERERAEHASAALNDAYRVLRNPLARAAYLLERQGLNAASGRQTPPELLHTVFELNENLERLRDGDESVRLEVQEASGQLTTMLNHADAELEMLFGDFDRGAPDAAARIRAVLDRRRFLSNLMAQLDRALTA